MKEKGKSGEKTVVREHCLRKLKQLCRAQVSQEKKVTEKQEEGVKLDEHRLTRPTSNMRSRLRRLGQGLWPSARKFV